MKQRTKKLTVDIDKHGDSQVVATYTVTDTPATQNCPPERTVTIDKIVWEYDRKEVTDSEDRMMGISETVAEAIAEETGVWA